MPPPVLLLGGLKILPNPGHRDPAGAEDTGRDTDQQEEPAQAQRLPQEAPTLSTVPAEGWGGRPQAAWTQLAPTQATLSTPAPRLRNPSIGTERVFASNQSISQTRKLRRGVSSRFIPLLSGRAGPKPQRTSTPGSASQTGRSPLFPLLLDRAQPSPSAAQKSTTHPRLPHTLPLPAGSRTRTGQGTRLGAAGGHPSRVQPLLAALVPPPMGEGRGGPPLQQRCDSNNISGLSVRRQPLNLLLLLSLFIMSFVYKSARLDSPDPLQNPGF